MKRIEDRERDVKIGGESDLKNLNYKSLSVPRCSINFRFPRDLIPRIAKGREVDDEVEILRGHPFRRGI